ncbi:hypothetical protein C0995_009794 [Termitomyces sp. Mi166|nr:hypothetical protein C0995_009794 [Termitomyces sp. Mi166\
MLSNKSDYGESSSEHEQESEEGESAAQHFQRMQYNKKLAAKKANKAKAEAALQHRAINDFSGRIPDGLGVKVWGLLNVEQLNSCFTGALSDCMYYSVHSNAIFIGANANRAAAFKYSSRQRAKMPASVVYKFALHSFPCTPYELEWLYKHYANEHAPHRNRVVTYLLINKLLLVVQKLDESLLDKTMRALLHDPMYRDLQNAIQGDEDKDFVVPRHIPTCFTRVKEDGMIALCVMRTLDPSQLFNLEQIVQYALIFGWLGLENTWQGIAFDFAYCMHWQTLFGFALCQALCATSAAKPVVLCYGTPPAIPQWDGWREISKDNHYRLLFKCDEEHALSESPEAKGLYYYIGMDPNQVHLWKRTAAHGPLPPVPTATNIAPVESLVVAAMTVSGPSAPPGPVPASQEPATNCTTGNVTMALESGEVPSETVGSGP